MLFAVSSLRGAICVGLFVGIRTVPYSCVQLCAVWPQHVVFTAHLRKRTIALRAADGLSVHRVCVPCCTVAEGLITVNKYLPTWSWGGSSGTFFGSLQKWIDLDELSQMAPVPSNFMQNLIFGQGY